MGHVKKTRKVIVLEVLDCLLQGDDVPFPRDVVFDGNFFLLSWASRKMGLALFEMTKWRSKIQTKSTFTQTVYPSRMDETSPS